MEIFQVMILLHKTNSQHYISNFLQYYWLRSLKTTEILDKDEISNKVPHLTIACNGMRIRINLTKLLPLDPCIYTPTLFDNDLYSCMNYCCYNVYAKSICIRLCPNIKPY